MSKQNLHTVEQLAAKMQVSERSLLNAIRSGELPAYKKFRKWFIFAADFEKFVKATGSRSVAIKSK
jgi:excisionase family DNA binding protein